MTAQSAPREHLQLSWPIRYQGVVSGAVVAAAVGRRSPEVVNTSAASRAAQPDLSDAEPVIADDASLPFLPGR